MDTGYPQAVSLRLVEMGAHPSKVEMNRKPSECLLKILKSEQMLPEPDPDDPCCTASLL